MSNALGANIVNFVAKSTPKNVWIDYGSEGDDVLLFLYEVEGAVKYEVVR